MVRSSESLFRVEALLLGYAGLLADVPETDEYALGLREEYEYQAAKFQLEAMNVSQWKFMRIRPIAFPTVRLALLASLMMRFNFLLSSVLDASDVSEIYGLLDVTASSYWDYSL